MSALALTSFRPIVRRRESVGVRAGLDLASFARVVVTSEQALFPIDNVFDEQRGPGGSCWIAEGGGEQTIRIALGAAYRVRDVVVESEQQGVYSQDIALAIADDGDRDYRELGTRSFAFKPYGPSFHTETWALADAVVTHVRLRITPGVAGRACLTSVVIHT